MWIDIFSMTGGMLLWYALWIIWKLRKVSWQIKNKEMRREAMDLEVWRIIQSTGHSCMEWAVLIFAFAGLFALVEWAMS